MTELERLGATLTRQIKKTAQANQPPGLDLGRAREVWRNDRCVYDLTSDRLRDNIPFGSYSVLNGAALSDGARVLIAWVDNEPIVLGRVYGTE